MNWLLKCFLLLALATAFFSCRKDVFITDSGAQLEFSDDTVVFDTVFTTVGTVTKRFKVYNRHKKDILISTIHLAGGSISNYRMNVDGEPTNFAQEVEIAAEDSMWIFVEATIDPNNTNNPLIVTDSILFETNGNVQDVDLVAWGQDAHFYNFPLFGDYILTNDKPHVFYGFALIDSNACLQVQEGAQLHFHKNSGIIALFNGCMESNGTVENPVVMQADRLENAFKDIPNQWGNPFNGAGIWFIGESKGGVFTHTEIKNGNIGIWCDSLDNTGSGPKLVMDGCDIKNMSGSGTVLVGSEATVTNSLFSNCGQYLAAMIFGGKNYEFTHCTFANFWSNGARETGSILMNNFIEISTNDFIYNDLENAVFNNCIITGNQDEELEITEKTEAGFEYMFNNCILKTELSTPISNFTEIIKNPPEITVDNEPHNPIFANIEEADYHLFDQSVAIDEGDATYTGSIAEDFEGNNRIEGAQPDLGCYEYQ